MNISEASTKIGRLLPKAWDEKISRLLIYAGREDSSSKWLGEHFLFSALCGFLIFLAMYSWQLLNLFYSFFSGIISFSAIFAAFAVNLSLLADKRASAIEEILPNALQLISANIRAGMTPDKAIWLSARPEFGQLQAEIKKVGSETLGGTPLADAFLAMHSRVKSRVLERTVKLIVEGMESGGELARLLSETANEIRSMSSLRKEMDANTAMYTTFITFASLIGAPLLLGISTFFVEMLTKLTTSINIGGGLETARMSGISLMGFAIRVSPDFLFRFSIAVIFVTAFFTSLLIGLIKKNNEKYGLEYVPMFVLIGIAIFLIVKYLISTMFGSFMAM